MFTALKRILSGSIAAIRIFTLVSLLSMTSGCSGLKAINELQTEKETLEAGEAAFLQGDYKLAETLFLTVINNPKSKRNKNTAIYNLACTKLIVSENDDEFIGATEVLLNWKASKKIPMYYENPELIVKAVLQGREVIKEREEEFKGFNAISDMHAMQEIDSIVKETSQVNTRLDKLLREQDGKIKTLNSIVKKQNEKIKLLNAIFKKENKEKEEMEKTISTLKHQISELESIDRKLQNKRKAQ